MIGYWGSTMVSALRGQEQQGWNIPSVGAAARWGSVHTVHYSSLAWQKPQEPLRQ